MIEPRRIVISPTEDGKLGPLDGPFTLTIDANGKQDLKAIDQELMSIIVGFVRYVARGISCYNNIGIEHSSNLKSYAAECVLEMQSENPEMAAKVEGLTVDYRDLPDSIRAHPIWKLDRAILSALPGIKFIE
jgi:hypothetical protein